MAKLSQVDKAIENLQQKIGEHMREIAALEAAIKALLQEKRVRKPRAAKAVEQVA